jgi:hypothetical protein
MMRLRNTGYNHKIPGNSADTVGYFLCQVLRSSQTVRRSIMVRIGEKMLHYGFFNAGKRRYNIKLWKTFTDCFNCLPIAAIGKYRYRYCSRSFTIVFLVHYFIPIKEGYRYRYWYGQCCESG